MLDFQSCSIYEDGKQSFHVGAQPVEVGPMPPLLIETWQFFCWVLDEVFVVDIGCLPVLSSFGNGIKT